MKRVLRNRNAWRMKIDPRAIGIRQMDVNGEFFNSNHKTKGISFKKANLAMYSAWNKKERGKSQLEGK